VPGQNAICVEVETRAPPARLALEGEIVLWSGEVIPIESDRSFKAAPGPPPGNRSWTEKNFSIWSGPRRRGSTNRAANGFASSTRTSTANPLQVGGCERPSSWTAPLGSNHLASR